MTSLRIHPSEWPLIREALEELLLQTRNRTSLDFAEQFGIAAAREQEVKAKKLEKLISRIVIAKEIHNA